MATKGSDHKYEEGECPIPLNKIRQLICITHKTTCSIIPNAEKKFENCNHEQICEYIIKMIILHKYYCVVGSNWVLDVNIFRQTTVQKLYIVADKTENSNNKWKVRDELFDEKGIYKMLKPKKLPELVMNDVRSCIYVPKSLTKGFHNSDYRDTYEYIRVLTYRY